MDEQANKAGHLARRKLLRAMVASSAVAGIAGCTGNNESGDDGGSGDSGDGGGSGDTTDDGGGDDNNQQSNTLRATGVTTSRLEDWSGLYDSTDIEQVNFTPTPHTGVVSQILEGEGTSNFSVLNHINTTEDLICSELREIDTDRVDWDVIPDFFLDDKEVGSPVRCGDNQDKLVGMPVIANADSFAYDEAVTGELDSYEAWFDPEWEGQVAIADDPIFSIPKTALYLKHNNMADISNPVSNMNPEEIEEVADFLIEKKNEGQFRTFWGTYAEAVDLLVSGEVVVMDAWEPMVFDARESGLDSVRYCNNCKEGYMKWSHNSYLLDGEEIDKPGMEDKVYQFLNYELSAEYGAKITSLRGYVSANPQGVEYAEENSDEFDVDFIEQRYETVLDSETGKIPAGAGAWLNLDPEHKETYNSEWQRVINA